MIQKKVFFSAELPPWQTAYRNMITRVVIEDGVTTIGDIAFSDCNALTTVELPASLKKISIGNLVGLPSFSLSMNKIF